MLYLLATSGILVGQHLCMDRVKDTALFAKVESKCGMSLEMHKDLMDCCEDEWSLKKVEDDQQMGSGKDIPAAKYHLLYENTFQDLTVLIISQEDELEVKNTGPPDIPAPDLNILYQNLKLPALQS